MSRAIEIVSGRPAPPEGPLEETLEAVELCGVQRKDEAEPCRNVRGECWLHCSGLTKAGERCPRRPRRGDPEGRCSEHSSTYTPDKSYARAPRKATASGASASSAGATRWQNHFTLTPELAVLRREFKKLERERPYSQELRLLAEEIKKLVTAEADLRITTGQVIGVEDLSSLINEFAEVIRGATDPDTADFILERFAQIFERYGGSDAQEEEE